jgi:serine/threonine-protein kinase RsbW
MDSSALGLLVWADRALQPRDGTLVLAGADRNVSRILEISGLVSAAPTLTAANDAADALSGLELSDDADEPLWVRELAFPAHSASLAGMRADVCEVLEPLEIPEAASFDIRVAVGEALANAIRHGSPRGEVDAVTVTVTAYRDRVALVIEDSGEGFDGESSSSGDPYASSGRGVMFMRALMDQVEFSRLPSGGTAVTLVRHIGKTAG